jgi:hypothetical protein
MSSCLFGAFGRLGGMELGGEGGLQGTAGAIGSENVDMSSDKAGERPARRKSKGSCLKLI